MRYKTTIAYDGTNYGGWQNQLTSLSIQEVIEKVLLQITQTKVSIIGSGRTDAGVHANGQVAHFDLDRPISLKSLNSLLPADIRILSLEEVDPTFHARFSVKEKTYLYHICTSKVQSPFERRYALHYTLPLDLEQLKLALPYFIGTKNFSSFANQLKADRDPVKTLFELAFIETANGFTLKFRGDGFLYKMVRNITGTLLDIGRGRRSPFDLPSIFATQSRPAAAESAPPQALFLESVLY